MSAKVPPQIIEIKETVSGSIDAHKGLGSRPFDGRIRARETAAKLLRFRYETPNIQRRPPRAVNVKGLWKWTSSTPTLLRSHPRMTEHVRIAAF
jgi:hypothetical protein